MLRWWTTRQAGEEGEERALRHLLKQGLRLETRNYRSGGGPRRPAGEVDLIMRDAAGTLVFVEVRQRRGNTHGGAAASVTSTKQRRLVHAAQQYLLRFSSPPPCRFDVVAIEGEHIEWLQAAFDAHG
jgi:putative endonuclease